MAANCLDIKASVQQYPDITGVKNSGERAWRSAHLIVETKLDYEVRTTIHPRLIDQAKLYNLVDQLVDLKVENYVIQKCVPSHCLNPGFRVTEQSPFDESDIQKIAQGFTNLLCARPVERVVKKSALGALVRRKFSNIGIFTPAGLAPSLREICTCYCYPFSWKYSPSILM